MVNFPYITKDTAFASFLIERGAKQLDTDYTADIVTFHFDRNGTDFKELEIQWRSGIAQGNITTFFRIYKTQIDEINRNRQGN